MAKHTKIFKFRPLYHLNIAVIVCVILLIYLGFHLISYLTGKRPSVYEVTAGTITQNNHYESLAIRQEKLLTTDRSGYLYYYSENSSRVGVVSPLYAIDDTGDLVKKLNQAEGGDTLSTENMNLLSEDIHSYLKSYESNQFSKIYGFSSDLTESAMQSFRSGTIADHQAEIDQASAAGTYHLYYADSPGLLLYSLDGKEGLTLDNFQASDVQNVSEKITDLRTTDKVDAGSTVGKLITSDQWSLVLPLDDSLKKKLKDSTSLKIRFDDDQSETYAGVSTVNRDGQDFLVLSLNDGASRYASQRYVAIELCLNEESGLKVPVSSITEKTFYLIPRDYFYLGNDSSESGLLVTGKKGDTFQTPDIIYETKNYCYIDGTTVKKGSVLRKPDSSETWTVGQKTRKLKGVYNVNKGYAVFNRIEILFQNTDYAVIRQGTSYGVSLYDHIALDGDSVKENDIIYRS